MVLSLGQDTLISFSNLGPIRSVDNGQTFTRATSEGTYSIDIPISIPFGIPYGGTVVARAVNSLAFGTYSRDRGASWHSASIPNSAAEGPFMDALTVVPRGPRAGRVVAVGAWGIATSDDGGATYRQVPGFWEYFRYTAGAVGVVEGAAPGGGDRILALVNYPGHVPDIEVLVAASDDGGDTWYELSELTGDPNYAGSAVVDFGQQRVAAVINGGHVWSSTDGGASWVRVGVLPGSIMDPTPPAIGRALWAFRGPDERLYVGGIRLGGATPGWSFRTAEPMTFTVAGEAEPEASERVGVSVRPNPASGRVEITLTQAEAASVRVVVVDVRGREVAVVWDGERASGTGAFGVDTSRWPAGVYVVRARVGGRASTARFTVVR